MMNIVLTSHLFRERKRAAAVLQGQKCQTPEATWPWSNAKTNMNKVYQSYPPTEHSSHAWPRQEQLLENSYSPPPS